MLYKMIASRPNIYKNMNIINIMDIIITNITKLNKDKRYFNITYKNYNIEILINKFPLNLNSDIYVYCDCDSFKYQFQSLLYKANGLILKSQPLNILNKLPKKKIIYVCKHIEMSLNKILKL